MDIKIKQIYIKNIVYFWQICRLKSTSEDRKFIALEWYPIKLSTFSKSFQEKKK